MTRRTARCFHLALSFVMILAVRTDSLAREDDEENAKSFIEGIASMVYGLAWPTATYESSSFRDFEAVRGGYDVVFRLSGRSAFDDSDLWVDLVFEFREGGLDDVRVLRHNAILMPPFATTTAIGEAIADAMEENTPSPPTYYVPPPIRRNAGVCMNNRTGASLKYWYRWGDAEWSTTTLPTGESWRYWMPYEGSQVVPNFQIAFDDDTGGDVTFAYRTLTLSDAGTAEVRCASVRNYSFVLSGSAVGLSSDAWLPGFPHPFIAHVLAADTEQSWKTEAGYRWYDPNDKDNLYAIGVNEGVIGVSIGNDQAAVYPTVVGVLAGGPAEAAGIRANMWIVSIDGKSMRRMSSADCVKALQGRPQTAVRIATGKGKVFVVMRR